MRALTFLLVAGALATAASVAGTANAGTDSGPTPMHAFALGKGAWTYFTDPRSVSDGEKTYTGWITRAGRVEVSSIEWSSGKLDKRMIGPRIGRDDHNNPALVLRKDGRISAFYSPHSGPNLPLHGKSHMYFSTTVKPGDITRWSRARQVRVNVRGGLGYTYPSPIMLPGGGIWLAWRGGNWLPTQTVKRDGGWKHASNITTDNVIGRKLFNGHLPLRPYTKYAPGQNGRIHMAYTDGHPLEDRTSIYYLSESSLSDRKYRANGSEVGRGAKPIGTRSGELVASWKTHGKTWVMDVADQGDGKPVIVYSAGWSRFRKVQFRIARWTGKRWKDSLLAWASDAPRESRHGYGSQFFSGGVTIDHNDTHRFFVSRGIGKKYRVQVMTGDAKDENFTSQVVSPLNRSCFRPAGSLGVDHNVVVFLCGKHRGWRRFDTTVYAAKFASPG
jgi:hypothetical protein